VPRLGCEHKGQGLGLLARPRPSILLSTTKSHAQASSMVRNEEVTAEKKKKKKKKFIWLNTITMNITIYNIKQNQVARKP